MDAHLTTAPRLGGLHGQGQPRLRHPAALASNSNAGNGLRADDDSSATIVNAAIASNGRDLVLGFGSSLTITASTFGSVTCDRTVLVRGDAGITCPAP